MWQAELAERLKITKPRDRKTIFDEYSKMTGHSKPQLYRVAKVHGFETGRTRSDKGVLKSGLTDGQINYVASIIYETGRENKGPIMPVERALQIAVDNGIIVERQITPVRLTAILKERQLSKTHMKAPAPHTEMRSLHPNHVHVFDVSVCIQYYLKDGKMGIMDERDYYKNKLEKYTKIKTRLMRYVIADHFSGAFHLKYYNAAGENADNLFDFLREAWAKKADEKMPFHGVPFNLLMDNGAANTARATIAMLERMDVTIPKGRPYNPRRQGALETMHSVIEEWFESGLRIQPAFDIETLNAWANDFSIWFQAVKEHTRHGMPRFQCWLLIKPEQLRLLPPDEILQDLFANPEEECTVNGDYSVRFRGNRYNVKHIEGLFVRAKVKAILKPYKWPKVDVSYQGKLYECEPITILPAHLGGFRADAAIIGEEYRSQPETATQQAKKVLDNIAYGDERKKDSIPLAGTRVFGHHAEKVENVSFMQKQGTPIEVDRQITEKSISMIEFFKRLRNEIGAIAPELNRELRAKYGESIDVKEAEEVIRRLSEGETGAELKKVSM